MASKSEGCNLVVEHLCSTQEPVFDSQYASLPHIVLWLVGITGHGHSLREEQLPGGISELVFRVPLSWGYVSSGRGSFFHPFSQVNGQMDLLGSEMWRTHSFSVKGRKQSHILAWSYRQEGRIARGGWVEEGWWGFRGCARNARSEDADTCLGMRAQGKG